MYSNENLNSAKNYDVGISKDYYPRFCKSNKYPEILYNFTGIYCNQVITSRGILDSDIADLEISILKKILKKYPTQFYLRHIQIIGIILGMIQ